MMLLNLWYKLCQVVSFAHGASLAESYGMKFFETSAKDGTGVQESFQCLATLAKKRMLLGDATPSLQTSSAVKIGTGRHQLPLTKCSC